MSFESSQFIMNDDILSAISSRGGSAKQVYFVGDVAVKSFSPLYKDAARNEFEMGKFLAENGIRVPERYCLTNIYYDYHVVMKRVSGNKIAELPENERIKAMARFKSEIEKVLELGICPHDFDWHENVLWDGDVWLLDLEDWRAGNKREISQMRREIQDRNFKLRKYSH